MVLQHSNRLTADILSNIPEDFKDKHKRGLYLKIQSVPRSKHSPSRLWKQIS